MKSRQSEFVDGVDADDALAVVFDHGGWEREVRPVS